MFKLKTEFRGVTICMILFLELLALMTMTLIRKLFSGSGYSFSDSG
jgi:hypothetical protein